MGDILWSDVSEWQVPVDDSYPYPVLAIRSNDGTYRDHDFARNYEWACRAMDSGRLAALIIYLVYRENWQQTLDTLKDVVGQPHPGTVFMIDVESWGGQIGGDQSDGINRLYWGIADWLGTAQLDAPRRVIGYGNANDLNTMWPNRPDHCPLIVAAYGANPDYPGKLGHQFTDGVYGGALDVPPFGYADVNSADGYDIDSFKSALGLGGFVAAEGELPVPNSNGAPMATLDQEDIDAVATEVTARVTKWLSDFIAGYVGPIGHDVKRVADQLGLARDDAGYDLAPGKPSGGNRPAYELLAALCARNGVPGTADTNPSGGAR